MVIILATLLSFNGCALFQPAPIVPVKISLPARPELELCAAKPDVSGTVELINGQKVVIVPLQDAIALSNWSNSVVACELSNQLRLLGHIEKLENRIRGIQ